MAMMNDQGLFGQDVIAQLFAAICSVFVLAADATVAAPSVWGPWGCTALAGSAGKVGAVQSISCMMSVWFGGGCS